MSEWSAGLGEAVGAALCRDEPCVLITVAATRGSAPRDAGTRMLVSAAGAFGTIGGGHLELEAIWIAKALLAERLPGRCRLERFPLGPALGQCCGGVVQLLFERLDDAASGWVGALEASLEAGEPMVRVVEVAPAADGGGAVANVLLVGAHECLGELSGTALHDRALMRARGMLSGRAEACVRLEPPLLLEPVQPEGLHIALFGAGHVGRAVIGVLGALPCRVTWVDSRAEEFPDTVPANVRVEIGEQPELEVDALPAGTRVLIMTHDHALDQAICERALRRPDLPWCGLIGSLGKRRRLEHRLRARGVPDAAIAGLTCPIGIDGIDGKHPGEIAVAVCAQILASRERLAERAVEGRLRVRAG